MGRQGDRPKAGSIKPLPAVHSGQAGASPDLGFGICDLRLSIGNCQLAIVNPLAFGGVFEKFNVEQTAEEMVRIYKVIVQKFHRG